MCIPQRSQLVDGASAKEAGVRLLPLVIFCPVASILAAVSITGKLRIPYLYLLVCGSLLQVLGLGLMATLDDSRYQVQHKQYAFQAILGMGLGLSMCTHTMMVPAYVQQKDIGILPQAYWLMSSDFSNLAVGLGAVSQMVVLGGTIGLALLTAIMDQHVNNVQTSDMKGEESIITADNQGTRHAYAIGFYWQIVTLTSISIVGLLALLLFLERQPRKLI